MLNPALSTDATPVAIGNRAGTSVTALRITTVALVALFFIVGIPVLNAAGLVANDKVQQIGRYWCYSLVALGAGLIWGYAGMLSLCQALFFCVGGYAMAMFLSLPQGGGIYEVPQFLSYVYYGHENPLPPFWRPFQSFTFAVFAGLTLSAILSTVFGFFIFRSRVRGVYFSIVTQAVAWGMWLLICQHEMLLGGTNGLTNFSKAFGQERHWIIKLYLLTLVFVVVGYLICRAIVRSRAGRVMVAIRDREMRLYFAGYKPYAFKVFAFTVGAMLGALGGLLYPAQFTIITPQNMDVQASIEIVIMVALGGRGKLWGSLFGAMLLMTAKSALTSDFAAVWPYIYGGIFVCVVLFFPEGFVGIWDQIEAALAERAAVRSVLVALPMLLVCAFAGIEMLGVWPAGLGVERFTPPLVGSWVKVIVLLAIFAGTVPMLIRLGGVVRTGIGITAAVVLCGLTGLILRMAGMDTFIAAVVVPLLIVMAAWALNRWYEPGHWPIAVSALAATVFLFVIVAVVSAGTPLPFRWKYLILIGSVGLAVGLREVVRWLTTRPNATPEAEETPLALAEVA